MVASAIFRRTIRTRTFRKIFLDSDATFAVGRVMRAGDDLAADDRRFRVTRRKSIYIIMSVVEVLSSRRGPRRRRRKTRVQQ